MLDLKNITKTYETAGQKVDALRGVSVAFRKSEFVAVLGPSGCGKTTLLNIIGGLDRYTSGEMTIAGRSTRSYKERDWDTYRNHSVGFVFQNYNLIPHQSVLANVELALTLSGVSRAERRKRAEDALKAVGLGDQIHKKPNQMSGGQMQRVAIARALVNDPEIVLADEPTGALDSATSVQIMEILRKVAETRLVIMVTHNPDLAEQYATRTVRLLDGKIVSDTAPYTEEMMPSDASQGRKSGMSFWTALSLSFQNLLTKKARTLMVAFAGSIGIIGIALILSLSTGVKDYINGIEADALSSYPLTIDATTTDSAALLEALTGIAEDLTAERVEGTVTTNTVMSQMYNAMVSTSSRENDLEAFLAYANEDGKLKNLTNAVQMTYGDVMLVFNTADRGAPVQVYPSVLFNSMTGMTTDMSGLMSLSSSSSSNMSEFWHELPDSRTLWEASYDLVAGSWPTESTDVLLVIDRFYRISDMSLYAQGIKDQSSLYKQFMNVMSGRENDEAESITYTYDELMDLRFTAVPVSAAYVYDNADGLWHDSRVETRYADSMLADGVDLHVCGIVQPGSDSVTTVTSGSILYTPALTEAVSAAHSSAAIDAQKASPDVDIRTGLLFSDVSDETFLAAFDITTLNETQQAVLNTMEGATYTSTARKYAAALFSTRDYATAITELGGSPTLTGVNIFPHDFAAKDEVVGIIEEYNAKMRAEGHEEKTIQYTDYVAMLMSSVSTIIEAITWVLVAFVAISLVVSSIMIGVITYISVLERTKEIGILRSIGASKRDIRRVFNAETMVVGFCAGALGVLVAWLLTFPANAIVYNLAEIEQIAQLPTTGAIALIVISMLLTLVAGLIPSGFAAKRDPVVALRTE